MMKALSLLAALMLLATTAAPAGARDGPAPLRVGLTGDSIVEDGGVTSTTNLAAAVRSELRRLGYDARGWGYVPAHGSTPHLQADGTVTAAPWRFAGPWTFLGLTPFYDPVSPIAHVLTSPFGADGHAVESASGLATATAEISGDRFAVLFVRAPDAGSFRFSVDGRTRTVAAQAATVDGGGTAWLNAPRDGRLRHLIEVAPLDGTLRFSGVYSERAPDPSRPSVAVMSLGRSCACAADAFPPGQRQALGALRLDLTVIMFGTNDQPALAAAGDAGARERVIAGLSDRAALALRHGGGCLIVPPARNARPLAEQYELRRLEHAAAAQAGCTYAPVFRLLWTGRGSVAAGYTVDGIHPTPAGYRLMAGALAPLIGKAAAKRMMITPAPKEHATLSKRTRGD